MGPFATINLWLKIQVFIPFILVVVIFFNIFNIWALVLKMIGFGKYAF